MVRAHECTKAPFEELERLLDRVRRGFEESTHAWDAENSLGEWRSRLESMRLDLVEHDDEFVATADLPGYERDDLDVRVSDHTLRITADHETEREEGDEHYLHRGRRHESMERSVELPAEVEKDAVNATMQNGVLTVTIPRLAPEEADPVEINIE